MRWMILGLALATPSLSFAQQPSPTDTPRARSDTLTRPPVTLHAVTITTTEPEHFDPSSTTRV